MGKEVTGPEPRPKIFFSPEPGSKVYKTQTILTDLNKTFYR